MKIENMEQLNVFVKVAFEAIMEIMEHMKSLEMRVTAMQQIVPDVHRFITRTEGNLNKIVEHLEERKDDADDDWWKRGGEPSDS